MNDIEINPVGKKTLLDIVKHLKYVYINEGPIKKTEGQEGTLKAYEDIIEDLQRLSEEEFTSKYQLLLERLSSYLDETRIEKEKDILEYYIYYYNTITDVVEMINPEYERDPLINLFGLA